MKSAAQDQSLQKAKSKIKRKRAGKLIKFSGVFVIKLCPSIASASSYVSVSKAVVLALTPLGKKPPLVAVPVVSR